MLVHKLLMCGPIPTELTVDETRYDLYAWGYANTGAFGDGTSTGLFLSPTLIGTDMDIIYITSGGGDLITKGGSSAYINSDNDMFVSGLNDYGQLGLGDTTNRTTWTQVPGKWQKILFSYKWAVAQDMHGELWHAGFIGWGYDGSGEISTENNLTWKSIGIKCNRFDISESHGVADSFTWGNNISNQCSRGPGTNGSHNARAYGVDYGLVVGEGMIFPFCSELFVVANGWATFAVGYFKRRVVDNWVGSQGDNLDRVWRYGFAALEGKIDDIYDVRHIKGCVSKQTEGNLVVLYKDGSVKVAGYNIDGCLGLGHTLRRYELESMPDNDWQDVSVVGGIYDDRAGIGLKNDGRLFGWGGNRFNGNGLTDSGVNLKINQIGTDTDWEQIAGAGTTVFALKRKGPPRPPMVPRGWDYGWVEGITSPPVVEFITTSLTLNEGSNPYTPETDTHIFTFYISITSVAGSARTWAALFDVTVTGSGASPAVETDFVYDQFQSYTAIILPTWQRSIVNVPVKADVTPESTKEFTITLSNPVRCVIGEKSTAIGIIVNDD